MNNVRIYIYIYIYKYRYIAGHEALEDWDDCASGRHWGRWLLWDGPTLEESIKYMHKKQNKAKIVSQL